MRLVVSSRDYGVEAQVAAEAHIVACWAWLNQEQDEAGDPDAVDPASAPFDGCQTCEVREILYAAWPILVEGVANGELTEPPNLPKH